MVTKKKEPFGGKQATPFGKKGEEKEEKADAKKKAPAKKTSRGK
jgi:hypothetical protein